MSTYSIVGMNFVKSEGIVAGLKPGAHLTLIREPENAHDKNAVAIYDDEGNKLGYVPKKQNAVLAQYIDQAGAELPVPRPLPSRLDGAMAADTSMKIARGIPAKFVRSPNSGYPQVSVSE